MKTSEGGYMADHRGDGLSILLQALPSLGAIAAWWKGIDIHWIAAALGCVFLMIQIAHKLWAWYWEWRGKNGKGRRR